MKTIKYSFIVLFFTIFSSCIVDTDLQEVPLDFFSPENSFNDKKGFEAALADVYRTIRTDMYMSEDQVWNWEMMGMDVDFNCLRTNDSPDGSKNYNENWYWNTLNKDNSSVERWWTRFYSWIYKANVIIDRAENDNISWTMEEKDQIVAEAKFLRAFAYHFLVNCWGDVPLVLSETTFPKFDYTRAPQEDVRKQCVDDLDFAIKYMQTIDKQPGGRAPKAAAYHLLSEVYITMGEYQKAIEAASSVINDPNFHLMTERFGTRVNFTFNGYDYQGEPEIWGDVYWDLFQEGNMNWSEGNHECIWNIQMDVDILGGGKTTEWGGNFGLERHWTPDWWRATDINGVQAWLKDTLSGRPDGKSQPTEYVGELIWRYKNDWNNDIRNSKYNIQRDFYWTNPANVYYGQRIEIEHMGDKSTYGKLTRPSFKKGISTVHYGLYQDPESGQNHDQGRIFKDWYIMRLAETYLLRAEAYLLSGDKQKAAEDINVVRARSKATPISATDVTIDLILDERARELYMEEFRTNTLMRMGKLVEYLMKYNDAVKIRGYKLQDYKNKFPIPQSEIEANKEAILEQNEGYE